MQAVISKTLRFSAVCGFQHSWREVTKMEAIKIILTVLEVIASVALIVVVLFQSGKESGMGAITGKNESYLGKSKFGSMDKVLASATKWIAIVWILVTLGLCLI